MNSTSGLLRHYLHTIFVLLSFIVRHTLMNTVSTNVFFTEFSNYLESILLSKEQLLITVDFNIHVDILDNPDSLKLLNLLESTGFRQHVTQPTHVHGHTLDLIIIITRHSDRIIQDPPQTDRYISDHASLSCKLFHDKPVLTANFVTYWKLKSVHRGFTKKLLSCL